MSKEGKFSPEFMGGVQLQSALMGLTLAFKKKYGDEAIKVSQAFAEQLGTMMGNKFKEKAGITKTGIHGIEKVFHIWLDPAFAPHKLKTSVEDNKLTVARESPTMCPAILVAKQMPMFKGVAKAVNPNVRHSNIQMSENKCIDRIEIT